MSKKDNKDNNEYFCPNCNAILNYQLGFSPDNGAWTCTECGQQLYGDDFYAGERFEGVVWYCDECGEILNKQDGFSDVYSSWTCTNCGHVNFIDEDEIYASHEEYDEEEEFDDEDYDDDYYEDDYEEDYDDYEEDVEEYDNESYSFAEFTQPASPEPVNPIITCLLIGALAGLSLACIFLESVSWGMAIALGVGACIVITAVLYGIYSLVMIIEKHPMISACIALLVVFIGYGCYSFIMDNKTVSSPIKSKEEYNVTYIDLKESFRDAGFINISCNDVDDLLTSQIDKENIVTEVSIDGKTMFSKGDEFSATDKVIITYHSPAYVDCPISAKEAKGKNYNEIQSQFKDAGFINIKAQKNDKVLKGLLRDNNEVVNISVDGNTSFSFGDNYIKDVEVIITYEKKN